jgi:H+-translocating NAD(P) transhydrogenase subunit alpha
MAQAIGVPKEVFPGERRVATVPGAAVAKPAATAVIAEKKKGHGSAGQPMSASTLAIMFGVAAILFLLIGAFIRLRDACPGT